VRTLINPVVFQAGARRLMRESVRSLRPIDPIRAASGVD
jgi:hypothetical protein